MGHNIQIVTLSPEQYEHYKQLRITSIKDIPEAYGVSFSSHIQLFYQ